MDQNVNGFVYFFEGRVSESAALNSLKMTPNFWPFCLHLLSVGTTGVQQMKAGFSVIFLIELQNPPLNILGNRKIPSVTKPILSKRNKDGGATLPDFKTQSDKNRSSLALSSKQAHWPGTLGWKPRHKSTHSQSIEFLTKAQEHIVEKVVSPPRVCMWDIGAHSHKVTLKRQGQGDHKF